MTHHDIPAGVPPYAAGAATRDEGLVRVAAPAHPEQHLRRQPALSLSKGTAPVRGVIPAASIRDSCLLLVMPGLVPGIPFHRLPRMAAWMPGTSPGMTQEPVEGGRSGGGRRIRHGFRSTTVGMRSSPQSSPRPERSGEPGSISRPCNRSDWLRLGPGSGSGATIETRGRRLSSERKSSRSE